MSSIFKIKKLLPTCVGLVNSPILIFSNFSDKNLERLFSLTHPTFPPVFELSAIL